MKLCLLFTYDITFLNLLNDFSIHSLIFKLVLQLKVFFWRYGDVKFPHTVISHRFIAKKRNHSANVNYVFVYF